MTGPSTYFADVRRVLVKAYNSDHYFEEAIAILKTKNYTELVELLEEYHEESCNATLEVIDALITVSRERSG